MDNLREDFPARFAQVKAIQESIGPGAFFLRFRSGPRKNERMSLAELPEGRGDLSKEPDFSCSFFCEMAKQDMLSPVPTNASDVAQGASPEAE